MALSSKKSGRFNMAKVTFVDADITMEVRIGTDFLDLYTRNPLTPLRFGCTHGSCGVCAIEVLEGEENLSPMTRQEKSTLERLKLPKGCRLACQCAVAGKGPIRLQRQKPLK